MWGLMLMPVLNAEIWVGLSVDRRGCQPWRSTKPSRLWGLNSVKPKCDLQRLNSRVCTSAKNISTKLEYCLQRLNLRVCTSTKGVSTTICTILINRSNSARLINNPYHLTDLSVSQKLSRTTAKVLGQVTAPIGLSSLCCAGWRWEKHKLLRSWG
jgi:hypothetical protein